MICIRCIKRFKKCIEFIELCQQSEKKLKELCSNKLYSELKDQCKERKLSHKSELNVKDEKDNKINEIQKRRSFRGQYQCSTCGKFMSSK